MKARNSGRCPRAKPLAAVAPAQAFMAMHWGSEVLGGRHQGGVNALTSAATCPRIKQPELKHAAVKLAKVALPWQLLARAWLPAEVALQRRAQAAGRVSALLMDELPAQAYGRALLAGTSAPPVAVPRRGVQVFNCFDITEPEINATLARSQGSPEARLA